MERGQKVFAKDFWGDLLPRVVWEEAGAGVLICTEENYRAALQSGEEPVCVGFPKQDVTPRESDNEPTPQRKGAGAEHGRAERKTKAG